MAAPRKKFTCSICNGESDKTVSNYYKQIKRDGRPICGDCGNSIRNQETSRRLRNKYKNVTKNDDLVKSVCPNCGNIKELKHRTAKLNLLCRKCAAVKFNELYKEKYDIARNKRIENGVGKLISDGIINKIPKCDRIKNAQKASEYWKDDCLKQKQLEFRKSDYYRQSMREIWNIPGYREKARERTKKQFLELWQNEEFRTKMAKIRSNMPKFSSLHKSLNDILISKNIVFINEYQVGPWVFDCYLPDFNVLIEVQGEYWHSIPKSISNDNAKASYVNKYTDYKLLYLFEREFYGNLVVQKKISKILGDYVEPVFDFEFEDVVIKIEPNCVIRDFLFNYHYLGTVRNGLNICFYHEDMLIGVCVISSCVRSETPRRHGLSPKESRELVRFCIHPNYQKKNLASWMLSKSIKCLKRLNKKYKRIYSFADPTFGHTGTIYKASNWIFDGESDGSYYYIDSNGWVTHKKSLYNMAVKMGVSESQYAKSHSYKKVRTLPKFRFYYDL